MGRLFVVPLLLTFGLLGWWLFALTTVVHFPGHRGHGPNPNVIAFNIVLILFVGLVWAVTGIIAAILDDKVGES